MRPIHFLIISALFLLASLYSCNEYACENTMCENGGVCMDGTCNCPEGYTGTYCQERTMPDKMRITSLSVTRFPALNDGGSWDEQDGPDIFFRLLDDTITISKPLALIENADPGQVYSFSIYTIELSHIKGKHVLQLLDYEGYNLTPQFMGQAEFVPYASENGLPETITIDNGGSVAFVITVEYQYTRS